MKGEVFWITGLPGSGKTTIGRRLCERLQELGRPAVHLDGDLLREIFGNDLGYDLDSRRVSAGRNSRLCKGLADQGLSVVCSTISLFHSTHDWNRSNIERYREIYLKVSMETLKTRDQKGLFSNAAAGISKNVIGVDIGFEEPRRPDMVVENDGNESVEEICNRLIRNFTNQKFSQLDQDI